MGGMSHHTSTVVCSDRYHSLETIIIYNNILLNDKCRHISNKNFKLNSIHYLMRNL